MARKAAAKFSVVGSARCADRTSQRDVPTNPQKFSSLLDTREVYCGDNLEHSCPCLRSMIIGVQALNALTRGADPRQILIVVHRSACAEVN